MALQLCLTVTFLDARFHGRRDGGEPEWPPSPLRLFQAIVSASAVADGRLDDRTVAALRWFERLPAPCIVAPMATIGEPYRLSVPNNAMDLVTKAWSRGIYDGTGDANPATHRTMKTVRPVRMTSGEQVRYVWSLPADLTNEGRAHAEVIRVAVRGIVALGWGVDLVVGHGEVNDVPSVAASPHEGLERWDPSSDAEGVPLRVPRVGTLDAVLRRHRAFLGRVTDDGFAPVPPLTTFDIANYRSADTPRARKYAAFKLVSPDAGREEFKSFPQHSAARVAAMLRHAACEAAKRDLDPSAGRDEVWGRCFIAGHGADPDVKRRSKGDTSPRLSYLALPTIQFRGRDRARSVGEIRRVLVTELLGRDVCDSIGWVRRQLTGETLWSEETSEAAAMLVPLAESDYVLTQFTGDREGSRVWTSVTPVVLPGYDDGKPAKRERLLWSCLEHAGILQEVAAIESRPTAWLPGVESSCEFRYEATSGAINRRPHHLRDLPTCHVRLVFRSPMHGPIALGAGRHCGLGVCVWEPHAES